MATILYKYLKKKHNQRKEENATSHEFHEITTPGDETEKPDVDDTTAVDTPPGQCSREEIRAARIYRCKIIAGLFLPFLVQSLDTTIIAGALPFIASDFSMREPP